MQLNNRISAIVTGGASGLGEATARALAAAGAKVAIFDIQEDRGAEIARDIAGTFCHVDVRSDESVNAGFVRARQVNGQERVLVCCAGKGNAFKTAGRSRVDGTITSFPLDAFDWVIQVNLVGTFRCVAKATAGMLTLDPGPSGERGVLVLTASVAAEDGQMGQAAYAAAKSGIVGMTLPIARDLAGEGIRVNTILPGLFDTPLMERVRPQVKDALAANVPFPKRLGRAEEYAHLALAMIENGYLNGEDVRLDGAIRMAPK